MIIVKRYLAFQHFQIFKKKNITVVPSLPISLNSKIKIQLYQFFGGTKKASHAIKFHAKGTLQGLKTFFFNKKGEISQNPLLQKQIKKTDQIWLSSFFNLKKKEILIKNTFSKNSGQNLEFFLVNSTNFLENPIKQTLIS